jgi:cytochrome c5
LMKKTFVVLMMATAVFACSRKTVATTTTPAPATQAATPPPPPPATTTASTDANAVKVAEGKTVYVNRCGRCHALKPVDAYTTAQWDGILKSMIPKAKLDAVQAEQVTLYVMANAKKA